MTAECNQFMLRRIADALGVSVDYFCDARGRNDEIVDAEARNQVDELLKAFADVTDVQTRLECIEYVRARRVDRPRSPSGFSPCQES